jgi:hypothetical protein
MKKAGMNFQASTVAKFGGANLQSQTVSSVHNSFVRFFSF